MSKPPGRRARGDQRGVHQRVRTARGRKSSSTRWLQRQLNDPYVQEAQRRGLRSRAAFKLIELDERFGFLRAGQRIVDLGAAPGGWTQVAVQRIKPDETGGAVVGLDIQDWSPVQGARCLTMDFLDDAAPDTLKQALGGPADIVLSDMSPSTTGHQKTDHLRIMALVEVAYAFAEDVLAEGGWFVCKVFQGGAEHTLLKAMKDRFTQVRHFKPKSSRSESAETYLVASGFKPRG